jgi:hypothetical protein
MFKVFPASLQKFIDTKPTLTPSVTPNFNYVTMVSGWNCLKCFCMFFILQSSYAERLFDHSVFPYILSYCVFVTFSGLIWRRNKCKIGILIWRCSFIFDFWDTSARVKCRPGREDKPSWIQAICGQGAQEADGWIAIWLATQKYRQWSHLPAR